MTQAKAAGYKKDIVAEIVELISKYPIIATINMENLPAPQLQKMRAELRKDVVLTMTKRRLIKIAFEQAEHKKKGIKQLEKYLDGMPALLFTRESPFKLFRILQRNKSPAPAKADQIAPKDIIVPAGPTAFAPGPIIAELSMAGVKAGVEGGKVAIKSDSLVARKGEKIKAKTAEVLTRLGIQPMEVGLDLIAAYEDGTIYNKDVLSVDETKFMADLGSAAAGAFNVAMYIAYPTKATIELLISKASTDARAIGISENIIDDGIIGDLLAKAERGIIGLRHSANITIPEKISKEEIGAIQKKEEKALSEEKAIIAEEKQVAKKKKSDTAVDKEVSEALKEEELKQLETERIDKEKEVENIEKQKHHSN